MTNLFRASVVLAFSLVLTMGSVSWASDTNINKKKTVSNTAAFTKVIEDLPLMPGLEPVEEKDVLFLSHTGRIAQTMASGSVDVDAVYQFYQKSLPQLGWKVVDARTYERGNERLRIDVSGVTQDAKTTARFSVQPISSKGE